MSNRYSHARVVSHYEAHGLTVFPSPYVQKPGVQRRTRQSVSPVGIDSSSANTSSPVRSTSSQRIPSLVLSEDSNRSLRATSSIITELFAPEHSMSPLFGPLASVESLTSSRSEIDTPRTSVSLARPLAFPGKYGRCGNLVSV